MKFLFMSPAIFVNLHYDEIKIFLEDSKSWFEDSRGWAMIWRVAKDLDLPEFWPYGWDAQKYCDFVITYIDENCRGTWKGLKLQKIFDLIVTLRRRTLSETLIFFCQMKFPINLVIAPNVVRFIANTTLPRLFY